MRLPIPIFFISFLILLFVLAFKRNRQTRNQENLNEAFLERERLANTTRKKDITTLDYLPYSSEKINFIEHPDETLGVCESVLKELSEKKILNLSLYSNTDLKLLYGPANLNDLMAYDDNYHQLSLALLSYAQRAVELGLDDAAIPVLEYSMSLKIDLSKIYLLLAELYQKHHMEEKIKEIPPIVSSINEDFANLVLPKLDKLYFNK